MSGEILIKDMLRTIGYQLNSTFHLSLRLYTLLNDYSKSCSKAVRPYTVIRVNVHIRRCVVSDTVSEAVRETVRPDAVSSTTTNDYSWREMESQLKMVHKVYNVVDQPHRKIFVTM